MFPILIFNLGFHLHRIHVEIRFQATVLQRRACVLFFVLHKHYIIILSRSTWEASITRKQNVRFEIHYSAAHGRLKVLNNAEFK